MEKLATGFQITILGMTIVFLILILLNLAMNGMNWILKKTEAASRKSGETPGSAGASKSGG